MQFLKRLISYSLLSLVVAIISAWYMIAKGSPVSVQTFGPWTSWVTAGSPLADPYTRAYIARSGLLPLTATSARYFTATTDSNGRTLNASCIYNLEGKTIDALWWSIAVYDLEGQSFSNQMFRYAFSKDNLFLRENGTYQITVSKEARPGNWLPVNGNVDFILKLRIYWPQNPDELISEDSSSTVFPKISRVSC